MSYFIWTVFVLTYQFGYLHTEDCQAYYDVTFALRVYQKCDEYLTCCGTCYTRLCCSTNSNSLKQRKCANNYMHMSSDNDDLTNVTVVHGRSQKYQSEFFDNRFIAEICIGIILFVLFLITLSCCLNQKCKEYKRKRQRNSNIIHNHSSALRSTLEARNSIFVDAIQVNNDQISNVCPVPSRRTSILNVQSLNENNKISHKVEIYDDEPPPYPGF